MKLYKKILIPEFLEERHNVIVMSEEELKEFCREWYFSSKSTLPELKALYDKQFDARWEQQKLTKV